MFTNSIHPQLSAINTYAPIPSLASTSHTTVPAHGTPIKKSLSWPRGSDSVRQGMDSKLERLRARLNWPERDLFRWDLRKTAQRYKVILWEPFFFIDCKREK